MIHDFASKVIMRTVSSNTRSTTSAHQNPNYSCIQDSRYQDGVVSIKMAYKF